MQQGPRAVRMIWMLGCGLLLTGGKGVPPAASAEPLREERIMNPYAGLDWDRVECVHSFSHQHGHDPDLFRAMGYGHVPLSNYYPSAPTYPLDPAFVREHPEILGGANAEQHSTVDASIHFNSLGSLYATGYGHTPRIDLERSPVDYTFPGLTVFDEQHEPWLGVYRLDLTLAPVAGSGSGSAELTVEGAEEVSHKTFEPIAEGRVQRRRLSSTRALSIYLKTRAPELRVRIDFDTATTRISRLRLMQGTNRPWRDAFRAALDGRRTTADGRRVEGLLFPDGGGITINHPWMTQAAIEPMLDFDPRVLGIEIWNHRNQFGGVRPGEEDSLPFYELWDSLLRSGRSCFGFFVKDHYALGRGRNVLLLEAAAGQSREEREHAALRAYREGRFFGHLGAMAVDDSGAVVPPYDYSAFRFSRISLTHNDTGQATGVQVAVTGADRAKRPNTQIRFVTDQGIAAIVDQEQAEYRFPLPAEGTPGCRYVRIEAFAYPDSHLQGVPLTAAELTRMNVLQVARLHDRRGDRSPTKVDPPGEAPIGIVDMIFSQPIRLHP